jgi:hypothetical protein
MSRRLFTPLGGWFVDARAIVVLCLLAIVSILLAAGSSIAWHYAAIERREERAARLRWEAARDSLLAKNWVPVCETCKVVNLGPRQDTLPRALTR